MIGLPIFHTFTFTRIKTGYKTLCTGTEAKFRPFVDARPNRHIVKLRGAISAQKAGMTLGQIQKTLIFFVQQ